MMALQLAIWGAWAPKLFPYMAMLGFTPGQQGLVGSCWGISSVLGVFFSNQLADRYFSAERFLAASHAIGALCLVGVAYSSTFWPFFCFFMAFSLVYVPTLSITNKIAFANLGNGSDYGSVRAGGTVGWIMVSWPFVFILGAHAGAAELRAIFIVAAAISFVLACFSLSLPRTPANAAGHGVQSLAWMRALEMLRQPALAILYLVTFIDSVVHNGYLMTSDAFLTNRVGIAGNLSMVVLSLGQLSEIITMLVLGKVLVRLGWRTTMIFGVAGHIARFIVFSFFADNMIAIVAVQFLHGVCYAFFFAAVYIFVDQAFPKDVRSSAQGLFNLLVLGAGGMVASYLFPHLIAIFSGPGGKVDYQALFLVPAGMATAAALLLLFFFHPAVAAPARTLEAH